MMKIPRRGENIYKRKDGRWEARYVKEITADGKKNTVRFMQAVIRKLRQNNNSVFCNQLKIIIR